MNVAIQKTLSLLLIILIGLLLKNKLNKKDHQQSIKILILNIALPTVIFVALMKLHLKPDLLVLPFLVLIFNIVFLLILKLVLPLYGVQKNGADMRTYMLLIPSLAPGLSCFPFITEYIGDDALARGALADIGNKIAVLFFSYMLAMHWFYKLNRNVKHSNHKKLKSLLLGMLNEPINLVMLGALIFLGNGFYLENFPSFIQETLNLLGNLMTPLILLFIGIAVVFKWSQFKAIFRLLIFRAGVTFCLSALLLTFMPGASYASMMLAVVFPQSACSFWPFAHMALVESMSKKEGDPKAPSVFNNELAMNLLALSLPASTLLILAVFSTGSFFINILNLLYVGLSLIILSIIPSLVNHFNQKKAVKSSPYNEKMGDISDSTLDENCQIASSQS
jgi:malate permease and related proteins